MEFLLASTWLALSIWVSEHGGLLSAVAVAGVAWRPVVRPAPVAAGAIPAAEGRRAARPGRL